MRNDLVEDKARLSGEFDFISLDDAALLFIKYEQISDIIYLTDGGIHY